MPDSERCFTVAEANALLPSLAERLPRLRRLAHTVREAAEELDKLVAVGLTDEGVLIMAHDYKLAKRRFDAGRSEFQSLLDALQEHGVLLKDLETGLVDFPAVIDGEEVLLCWRLGEPAVAYYHSLRGGFAGRRPIPPATP